MAGGSTLQSDERIPENEDAISAQAQEITEKVRATGDGLISVLEEIQLRYGYLPEKALRTVAETAGKSLVDVYGVATFYRSFSLEPRGKHLVCACVGTACHVRGAPMVVEEFERQLGIPRGETTADKEFTLETANCLGACALGPIVVIDGRYFSKVGKSRVRQLLDDALAGFGEIDVRKDPRVFPVEVSCPCCNHSLMDESAGIDGHPSIRVTVSFDRKHGSLRLSSLYGSYNILAEPDIPEGTVVGFFCPHCHATLSGFGECPTCRAPMVAMIVRGGGMVQVCSRRGCKNHMLDLV
ncbi:MAG: NAD(P)H-dependent oxidoreductase subunit E [Planctomycetes bacterium]|nr:NAD(P)H-dependent oxidoreductase subunit E [Planctomycetota bacterium]